MSEKARSPLHPRLPWLRLCPYQHFAPSLTTDTHDSGSVWLATPSP